MVRRRRQRGGHSLPLLLLLTTTAACVQGQSPESEGDEAPAPGDARRLPRVIILRNNAQGQVFSATFQGQETTTGNTTTNAPPSVQVEAIAPTSGLEIAAVNISALNDAGSIEGFSSDFGSPEELEQSRLSAFCRQLLAENPDLKICEPDNPVALEVGSATPNDPLRTQQWALNAINANGAWKADNGQGGFGNKQVRVCMVDTGLDYFHPDLAQNLWRNPKEIPNNGKDDDNNGIVDDVYGANFVQGTKSGDPYDDNGHGTFVAGVVGAVGNNGVGASGISQVASIIGCKFMDASGNGWISDAIRCFDYCTRNNAHIVSNSWGVYANSGALQAAAQALDNRGILITASAGNSARNTDSNPHVPSTLTTANMIAVGATQQDGNFWAGSNYGPVSVDVAAPGVSVLGLGIGGSYVSMTGTSMACPQVTGVAAIVLGKYVFRGFSISTTYPSKGLAAQVKSVVVNSVDPLSGAKKVVYGKLNAAKAIAKVPPKPPQRVAAAPRTIVRAPTKAPTKKLTPLSGVRREGAAAPAPRLAEGESAGREAAGTFAFAPACVCTCSAEPEAAPGGQAEQAAVAPAPSGQRLIRSIAPDGRVILTDPTTGTTVPPTAMAGRKMLVKAGGE